MLARAVRLTLGPRGLNVMIGQSSGAPLVTRDGVTVAKAMTLSDPFQRIGAQMLRDVATQTSNLAGDGTTTAILLAQVVAHEGLRAASAGLDPMDLKRGIDRATATATETLRRISLRCKDTKMIAQVGTSAANSDESVGRILARAMEAVGKDGVITVEESDSVDDSLELVEGMQFDFGYVSPWFVGDHETMSITLEEPYILLCNQKIQFVHELLPLLEMIGRSGKPLLVVAAHVLGEALALLVINRLRGSVKTAAVKAPGFGDRRKARLDEIAALTGGTVLCDEMGMTLEKTTLEYLGTARRVHVSKDTTTILDGGGDGSAIASRVAEIRGQIDVTTSDYEREQLEDSIGRLTGGIAIIKVGAASEVAMQERRLRVEDALHATRAAVAEGIVPGGGVALIRVCKAVEATPADNRNQATGIRILLRALEEPLRQIVKNGGMDPSVVLAAIRAETGNFGFNAATEEYGDMVNMGVVDPVKVTRLALQNAASIAGLFLTTEVAVASLPPDARRGRGMKHTNQARRSD